MSPPFQSHPPRHRTTNIARFTIVHNHPQQTLCHHRHHQHPLQLGQNSSYLFAETLCRLPSRSQIHPYRSLRSQTPPSKKIVSKQKSHPPPHTHRNHRSDGCGTHQPAPGLLRRAFFRKSEKKLENRSDLCCVVWSRKVHVVRPVNGGTCVL